MFSRAAAFILFVILTFILSKFYRIKNKLQLLKIIYKSCHIQQQGLLWLTNYFTCTKCFSSCSIQTHFYIQKVYKKFLALIQEILSVWSCNYDFSVDISQEMYGCVGLVISITPRHSIHISLKLRFNHSRTRNPLLILSYLNLV